MKPLDDLFALYASPAARQIYDEDVTELDHALKPRPWPLQTAQPTTSWLLRSSTTSDTWCPTTTCPSTTTSPTTSNTNASAPGT